MSEMESGFEPNKALRASFMEFSHWSRLQALSMRIEACPKVQWSEPALGAFKACQEEGADALAFDKAAKFMDSEWAASPARSKLASDLSMLMALAAPGESGSYDLHHPLAGTAMRAPNPLEGTPYAQKSAPANLRSWRAGASGEPEIDSWASVKPAERGASASAAFAFKASVALEGGQDYRRLEEIAAEAVRSAMGPAASAAQVALGKRIELMNARPISRIDGGQAMLRNVHPGEPMPPHMVHLANLRLIVAITRPGLRGKDVLARAVGEALASVDVGRKQGPALGWLWSVEPTSGLAWDMQGASELARESAKARERLKNRYREGQDDSLWQEQRSIDMALASLEPWTFKDGRGVPDREARKEEIDKARSYGKKSSSDLTWFIESCQRDNLRGMRSELCEGAEGPKAHSQAAPSGIRSGRRYQSDLENLSAMGGRVEEAWRKECLSACKAASLKAEKAAANLSKGGELDLMDALWRASSAVQGVGDSLAKSALAIASAREQRWASDHGLADAAARVESGEGARVKIDDLEAECARRRVSRASSPAAKLWAALEALSSDEATRGEAARKSSRKWLALGGWGASDLDAFAKSEACKVFLACVESMLEAKADIQRQIAEEWKGRLSHAPKFNLSVPGHALLAAFAKVSKEASSDPLWTGADPLAPAKLAKAAFCFSSQNLIPKIEKVQAFCAPGMPVISIKSVEASKYSKIAEWMHCEIQFETRASSTLASMEKARARGEGFKSMASRAKEVANQAGCSFKWAYDQALGRQGVEPEPFIGYQQTDGSIARAFAQGADAAPKAAPKPIDLMQIACMGVASEEGLAAMPTPWAGASELSMSAEKIAARSAMGESFEMVASEGFVGAMACMAAKAGRVPEFKPGADARSKANAWLGEGKRAAREWLGLTDATMKIAADFGSAGREMMELAHASAKVEAQAKGASLPEDIDFGGGKSTARIMTLAASRGLGAIPALAAIEALKAWGGKLNKIGSREWMAKALAPVAEGMTLGDALFEMGVEQRAKSERSERFEVALLERAGEIIAKSNQARLGDGRDPMGAAEAGTALSAEVSDISDWTNDWVGRFWANLPEKFGWKDLARGSKRWHDEQLAKSAASGEAWEPLGLSWSDEALEMSVVELVSPLALSEEGKTMRHCVGGYSETCRSGSSRVFSIRKNGARLTTLELKPPEGSVLEGGHLEPMKGSWSVKQHKGVCNCSPSQEAMQAQAQIVKALESLWEAKAQEASAKREKAAKAALGIASKQVEGAQLSMDMDLPGFDAQGDGLRLLRLREEAQAKAKPAKGKAKV